MKWIVITEICLHFFIIAFIFVYYTAPSGPPTDIRVEPVDQKTLKVFWKPPEKNEWNGEIQGYYVGYKPSAWVDKPYVFETVEFNKEDGKEHHLEIHNLK